MTDEHTEQYRADRREYILAMANLILLPIVVIGVFFTMFSIPWVVIYYVLFVLN